MCGILGVRKAVCPHREAAGRALDALRWRGPDGARLIEVGGWWLGVARLAITDPAHGQPIVCPRTGRAVALNGAITSAAADWPRYAGRARTRNDAELLLLRDEDGGVAAAIDVTGPYAWAIVDPRDDSVALARDPEGEKPLWVALDARGVLLAFASTPAALRRLGFGLRPDAGSAFFLRFGFPAGTSLAPPSPGGPGGGSRTPLPLPPGLHREDGAGLAAVASGLPRSIPRGRPLAAALPAAVARCAGAEVPVALALSGGIDSACIAVELRAAGPAVPGYQARAVGEDGGERARARAVAAQLGLELREVDVDATALRALPALTAAHGLPLGDPSVLAVHALAQRAAADGVRVLLSGEGADELLLGYPRHRLAARLPRHGLGGLPAPGLRTSRLARAWRALASPDPYDALLEVAPPGFRRRALTLPDAELCGPLRAARPQLAACSTLALARHADRVAYLREDLLPKLDVATMAAGVEGRCPFLDPEVLGCREAVTEDLRALLGKRPLRARYAAALPPGHFDQHKRGFAVPLDRWWREDEFLPDLLLERRSLERPHLRPGGVRWLLDRHRAGRARLGHALYLLVAHELHLRSLEDPA